MATHRLAHHRAISRLNPLMHQFSSHFPFMASDPHPLAVGTNFQSIRDLKTVCSESANMHSRMLLSFQLLVLPRPETRSSIRQKSVPGMYMLHLYRIHRFLISKVLNWNINVSGII